MDKEVKEKAIALKAVSNEMASKWQTLPPNQFIEMISEIFPHIDREEIEEIVMLSASWVDRHF